jgi:hypothetical protein
MDRDGFARQGVMTDVSDDVLLTATDPEAFGAFCGRHAGAVEAYFRRRVADKETACVGDISASRLDGACRDATPVRRLAHQR